MKFKIDVEISTEELKDACTASALSNILSSLQEKILSVFQGKNAMEDVKKAWEGTNSCEGPF